MIIKLDQRNDGLLPRRLLSNIQVPLYHTVYKVRHPLGLYNISSSTVLDHFSTTITKLFQVVNERTFLIKSKEHGDRSSVETLLANQKDLLYALMEYLEDCENILLCFFPSRKSRDKNSHVKSYRKATAEYRNHIGKIVNYLKHNQGRLRSIAFFNDDHLLPGYYVVGADEEGTVGAVEQIHAGGNTAFSFARDLRYNLFHFYAVSQYLSDALGSILEYEQKIVTADNSQALDKRILKIALDVSSLPLMFYPDEVNKPAPTIAIANEHDMKIILTYPDDNVKVKAVQKGMYIIADQMGDEATRSFRFPYIHKKN